MENQQITIGITSVRNVEKRCVNKMTTRIYLKKKGGISKTTRTCLEEEFKKIHNKTKEHENHGFSLSENQLIIIPCHWDIEHMMITANNICRALNRLYDKNEEIPEFHINCNEYKFLSFSIELLW